MQNTQLMTQTDVMIDWSDEIQRDTTRSETERRNAVQNGVISEITMFRNALMDSRPIISLATQVNITGMITGIGITSYYRGEIASKAFVLEDFVNSDRWVDRFEFGVTEGLSMDNMLDTLEWIDAETPYLVSHGYSNLVRDLQMNEYDINYHDHSGCHYFDTAIWSKPLMADRIMRPRKLADMANFVRVVCPEVLNPGNRARLAMEVAISVAQNTQRLFSK